MVYFSRKMGCPFYFYFISWGQEEEKGRHQGQQSSTFWSFVVFVTCLFVFRERGVCMKQNEEPQNLSPLEGEVSVIVPVSVIYNVQFLLSLTLVTHSSLFWVSPQTMKIGAVWNFWVLCFKILSKSLLCCH